MTETQPSQPETGTGPDLAPPEPTDEATTPVEVPEPEPPTGGPEPAPQQAFDAAPAEAAPAEAAPAEAAPVDEAPDVVEGGAPAGPRRHAVARPVPIPPDPEPGTDVAAAAPVDATVATHPVAAVGDVTALAPSTPEPAAEPVAPHPALSGSIISEPVTTGPVTTGPVTTGQITSEPITSQTLAPAPGGEEAYDFPDPHPPTAIGWGAHVLAVLVGLVVGPVGAVALLLGQSRILAAQADGWNGDVEIVGIALVAVGALILGALVLLASWSAAAPITGGVVTTLVGGYALVAPGYFGRLVVDLVSSDAWRLTVRQTVVAATSGTLVTIGVLLLAAGIAGVVTRRHGLRLGAFRERHRA